MRYKSIIVKTDYLLEVVISLIRIRGTSLANILITSNFMARMSMVMIITISAVRNRTEM